jgi:DNA-binding HxlR family transcriptional regulator
MIKNEDLAIIAKAFKKSPVTHIKKMINKKFTFTILLHIWFLKQHKFGELNTIQTMNSKTLTYTLKDMIKNELIRKKVYQKSPRVTKYFITKKGQALIRVYIIMINFTMEYYSKEILIDEKPKKLQELLSKEMLKLLK